jgi:cytidyltransferase-like protein
MSIVDQSFFFTPLERDNIAHAKSLSSPRASILTTLLYPLWSRVGEHIPETVAPNSITLVGTLATVQAYYLVSQYFHTQPTAAAVIAAILLLVSAICGALDGVHARRYATGSPLGDIFSKICGSTNHVFQALTLLNVIGFETTLISPDAIIGRSHGSPASAATFDATTATDSVWVKWYVLLALQLVEFLLILGRLANTVRNPLEKSVTGQVLGMVSYGIRESEISSSLMLVLCGRLMFPSFAGVVRSWLIQYSGAVYSAMMIVCLASLLLIGPKVMPSQRRWTIFFCISLRCVPMVLLLPLNTTSDLTVFSDAVVVSLLTVEVYVSHIASRRIHAAVIFICCMSLVNALTTVALVIFYLVGMLADLSYSTRIPLFVPVRNVFIDGVYDLCHIGHKKVMKHALQFGNRLLVGVLSDEDCIGYKRRPVMTTEERCREVESCRFVSEVIAGSPVDGLTEEFLKKHNIHVVVCGEEYDKPDDKYYAVPRRLGILKTAPRTEGMSTSVLIKRIQEANEEELVAKDKLRGDSVVKDGA